MPLSVEIASELADWPDVDFVLAASSEPSVYDREQLDRLLIGWYDVGVHGGYGPSDNPNGKGLLHNMTEPSYSDDEDGFHVAQSGPDFGTVDFGDPVEGCDDPVIGAGRHDR